MKFVDQYWLLALPVVIVFLWTLFYYSGKVRKGYIDSFTSSRLLYSLMSSFSPKKRLLKQILFVLGIVLVILALARPQWGNRWEEQQAKGIDVLIALDVSKSMLAQDIRPNRLDRAKYAIEDLLAKMEGDRIGLLVFAGNAFLQCPLTLDYSAFRQSLVAANTESIYRGGTDIAKAIRTAELSFTKEHNYKFLILITDGEDLEDSGIAQAERAAKNDLVIYTVGVGSESGELIPVTQADGSTDYLRDTEGKLVKTKLDASTLRKIAEASGGFYVPLGPTGEGLEKVYEAGLEKIPEHELTSSLRKVPLDHFQWPLGLALILFFIEWMLSSKRKNAKELARRVILYSSEGMKKKDVASLILIMGITILGAQKSEASADKGYMAYEDGKYKEAVNYYQKTLEKKPSDERRHYNLATAFYKDQEYESAGVQFTQSIDSSEPEYQQKVFYNLGNVRYRQGQLSRESNPEATIELWEESLTNYQSAIDIDPEDHEAQENLDFVKKQLEELKQEEQENQEKEEEDNNKEDKKDQEQNNDKSSEDKENQKSDNENQEDNQQEEQKNESAPDNKDEPSGKNDKQEAPTQLEESKGNMTQEEARRLLDSMQGNEKKFPMDIGEADNDSNSDKLLRNW